MVSIKNLIKTNQILLQDELLPKSVGFDKTKTNFARKRVIITSILLLFFWVSSFSFVQKFWHKCFLCFYFFLSQKIFNYIVFILY